MGHRHLPCKVYTSAKNDSHSSAPVADFQILLSRIASHCTEDDGEPPIRGRLKFFKTRFLPTVKGGFTGIPTRLSSCQYHIHFVMVRSAKPITGPPRVLRRGRDHAGLLLFRSPRIYNRWRYDVLQVSRSSFFLSMRGTPEGLDSAADMRYYSTFWITVANVLSVTPAL
jgi:hypothetical protein